MKAIQLYILPVLVLTMMASCFCSCSQPGISDDNTGLPPLNIRVSDGGYVRFEKSKKTQGIGTEENDFTTKFTVEDQIGLFGVKDNQIVDNLNNIRLTAQKNGDDIFWQTDDKKPLKLMANVTYYAYYPYRTDLQVQLHPEMDDAAKFFADLISGWNTDADQSDHEKYTANDLMIAKSTPKNKILRFNMNHAMALVVMDFQRHSRYVFTNKVEDSIAPITDYSVNVPPPPTFDKIEPWHTNDYTYRYLINPNQSSGLISGEYSWVTGKWEIHLSAIKSGQYRIYDIGKTKSDPLKVVFDLEPGDYYLKDGSLLKKDFILDDVFKAGVRGIVFKAGRNTKSFCLDTCKYKLKDGVTVLENLHGYVQAMYDGGDLNEAANYYNWGSSINIGPVGCNTSMDGFYGYSNTQKIKQDCAKNPALTHNLETDFPATYWANVGYDNSYKIQEGDHKAPDSSSGWFLPSIAELGCMYNQKAVFENSAKKAGGQAWEDYSYWSSSELEVMPAYGALAIDVLDDGYISPNGFTKNVSTYYIRAILVF